VRLSFEDYGRVQSLRVFYRSGAEVEFGISGTEWAEVPPDPGTAEVLRNGAAILLDRDDLLVRLLHAVRDPG
jgi:hypothetical protein